MRKYCLLYIFLVALLPRAVTQQAPIYSQYVLNEFIINPAIAGIDGMTSINFSGRKQWAGLENAPETYLACISTRVLRTPNKIIRGRLNKGATGRVGLGLALYNDKNGAVNRTGINLTYAYHIFMDNRQFSMGLSLLTQQFSIDSDLANFGYDDPSIPIGIIDPLERFLGKSTYIPDAAFGLNFSTSKFNLGLSAFQLLQSPIKFGDTNATSKQLPQVRQYYLISTYKDKLPFNKKWEYEPSIIIRATESLQSSADFSFRMIYNREYWAGISLRTSLDFVILLGLKVNRLYLGYSFDYGFNEISRQTYGSHEALIAIKLGESTRRYRYLQRY